MTDHSIFVISFGQILREDAIVRLHLLLVLRRHRFVLVQEGVLEDDLLDSDLQIADGLLDGDAGHFVRLVVARGRHFLASRPLSAVQAVREPGRRSAEFLVGSAERFQGLFELVHAPFDLRLGRPAGPASADPAAVRRLVFRPPRAAPSAVGRSSGERRRVAGPGRPTVRRFAPSLAAPAAGVRPAGPPRLDPSDPPTPPVGSPRPLRAAPRPAGRRLRAPPVGSVGASRPAFVHPRPFRVGVRPWPARNPSLRPAPSWGADSRSDFGSPDSDLASPALGWGLPDSGFASSLPAGRSGLADCLSCCCCRASWLAKLDAAVSLSAISSAFRPATCRESRSSCSAACAACCPACCCWPVRIECVLSRIMPAASPMRRTASSVIAWSSRICRWMSAASSAERC